MKNDNENYLLGEMEAVHRNEFEDRIFADDELFFELCETENDLVDRFVAGRLANVDAKRLEIAIDRDAGLAAKVANARTLRDFVRSERREEANEETQAVSVWDRVRALFTISPAPAFASGGLIVVMAAACVFLLLENGRRNAEMARLESELSNSSRGADLERELTDSRSREVQLQGQVDEERDISGDIASDLAREREYRRRLQRELAALKKPGDPETTAPGGETVTVLKLDPSLPHGTDVTPMNSDGAPERISLLISVPASVPANTRVSIRLNGIEIRRNIALRNTGSAGKQVNVVINTNQLSPGQNVVTVHGSAGNEIASYEIPGGPVK